MLSTVLIAWESKSAVTVVRSSSSTSEKPVSGINPLLSWSAPTVAREDSGKSPSESEDSEEEITSASFEGDAASII